MNISYAPEQTGIARLAIRSTAVTAAAQIYKISVLLISTVILARLLSPSDFGLVAMATMMTGLLARFKDGGLSLATIQHPDITHGQLSNLFWINVAMGCALTLICVALAPFMSYLFTEPRVGSITQLLSIGFLISAISIQHDALIRRQMRFHALAMIECAALTIGTVTGAACALSGAEYWSLVAMPLTTALAQSLLTWFASDWRPSLFKTGTGVWPLLAFGLNFSAANFVGYLAGNMTQFIIGLIGGSQQLGYFNRASFLATNVPSVMTGPLVIVAQPALARVASEPERFRRAALTLLRNLGLITIYVTTTLAVLADWIILVLLGTGWEATVPMFRALAVFALVEPTAALVLKILLSAGHAKAVFHWKLLEFAIVALSLLIGSAWGVMGIIIGYSLSGLLVRLPLLLIHASRFLSISVVDFAKAIMPSILSALILSLVLISLRHLVDVGNAVTGLLIFAPLSIIIYGTLVFITKQSRLDAVACYKLAFKNSAEKKL